MKQFLTIGLALIFLGCGQEKETKSTTSVSEKTLDKTQNLFELIPSSESLSLIHL